jgi:transposase-like protein
MNARKESGLSIKAFCEDAGIHDNTYYYWQRRLRLAASGALHGTDLVPSGFAEVTLSNQPVTFSPAASTHNQVSIESSGIRITAGSEYPADKLAVVLREVVRTC